MTPHQYLETVLTRGDFDEKERPQIEMRRDQVESILEGEFASKIQTIKYSGSLSKGTAIKTSHDIDIAVHFKRDSFETLKEMYDAVFDVLGHHYGVRRQRVSVGLVGADVDVVPGRRINPDDSSDNDVFLYRNDGGERIKTNIEKQKEAVRTSGVRDLIKLTKMWRDSWNLDFKSFALELLVMRALEGSSISGLDARMKSTLEFISANLMDVRLVDPGNSANNVADSVGKSDKTLLRACATTCLKYLNDVPAGKDDELLKAWEKVFNSGFGVPAEAFLSSLGRPVASTTDFKAQPNRTYGSD